MATVKTSLNKGKGPQTTSKTKHSLPSAIKQRLETLNTAPTHLYQREPSRVYTVICIAFVGLTLIGLGVGLVIYASDVIVDLVVIGAFGVFVGIASLLVALGFLVKPFLEGHRRQKAVATTVQKQRNVSVAPGFNGYVYRDDAEIDLSKAVTPSTDQLYELEETSKDSSPSRGKAKLSVFYPSDNNETPTYEVEVQSETIVPDNVETNSAADHSVHRTDSTPGDSL